MDVQLRHTVLLEHVTHAEGQALQVLPPVPMYLPATQVQTPRVSVHPEAHVSQTGPEVHEVHPAIQAVHVKPVLM